MKDSYPEEFIRGVAKDDQQFITPEGYATQAVFSFDEYDAVARHNDGLRELSVNWMDDEGAVTTLLRQVNARKGGFQFAGGYCRIATADVDILVKRLNEGDLSYERSPIPAIEDDDVPGNPYHGNLLARNELSKPARTNIQASLATLAGTVVRRSC